MALSDFTGNGNLDIAVANNGGTVSVLLGNGDGSFQPAQNYPAGNFPVAVAAADLNGDGFPDLVVAKFFGIGTVTVLLNAADWDGGVAAVLSKPRSVQPTPDGLPTAPVRLPLDFPHVVSEPHAIAQTTLDPTTTPVQPPLREILGGPTSQPDATWIPRPLVLAGHPPDAVFERLGDPVVDGLAVSLMQEGR